MSQGTLRVELGSTSMFLTNSLSVEIRNANRALIHSFKGSKQLRLDPGLYSVSAVLDDGRLHEEVVLLKEDGIETVKLDASPTMPLHAFAAEPPPPSPPEGLAFFVPEAGPASATLVEIRGAAVERSGKGEWVFVPRGLPETVPAVRIRAWGRDYTVSLPVNPLDSFPTNSCTLRVRQGGGERRIEVQLARERTVASTISRMMEGGFLEQSASVAGEATDLLVDKYRDPVGAALGGLLLHRLGRLRARRGWVENLARDFSWLPDGRVLLASLLAASEVAEERKRGLQLLLEAAPLRMMFADGLSLALELLRRWPDTSNQAAQRQAILRELSGVAAGTEWHQIVLVEETARA